MARSRSPNRDKAFEIWRDSNGTAKLKDIAAELGVSDTQVRKWKNQDKWDEQLKVTLPKSKSNVTKRGAPKGNQNAVGHGAPEGNQNASKHGLFAKYLPPDVLELVEGLQGETKEARLKRQIAMLEAQIYRAQMIMNVNAGEIIRELKRQSAGATGNSEEWEIQFAWDRHGNFLNSLSRAMNTLASLYKTLNEFGDSSSEDTKAKVAAYRDVLSDTAQEVWDDGEEEE